MDGAVWFVLAVADAGFAAAKFTASDLFGGDGESCAFSHDVKVVTHAAFAMARATNARRGVARELYSGKRA